VAGIFGRRLGGPQNFILTKGGQSGVQSPWPAKAFPGGTRNAGARVSVTEVEECCHCREPSARKSKT